MLVGEPALGGLENESLICLLNRPALKMVKCKVFFIFVAWKGVRPLL